MQVGHPSFVHSPIFPYRHVHIDWQSPVEQPSMLPSISSVLALEPHFVTRHYTPSSATSNKSQLHIIRPKSAPPPLPQSVVGSPLFRSLSFDASLLVHTKNESAAAEVHFEKDDYPGSKHPTSEPQSGEDIKETRKQSSKCVVPWTS